jgi:DNA-binding response OmpR family regulator
MRNTMSHIFPILLIEDDINDVWLTQHAWKKAEVPCPLVVVRDGLEGIEYLGGEGRFAERSEFPLPSLILLDLNLPRKRGFDVLIWLRERSAFNAVIVIVLTSSSAEKDVAEAYRLGANSYLVKPNDPSRLVALCKALKSYWIDHNQLPTSAET